MLLLSCSLFFFFNDTATTEIYTLSLHDALPISDLQAQGSGERPRTRVGRRRRTRPERGSRRRTEFGRVGHLVIARHGDRKSTRLNSSHGYISYAVFCLKKKKLNPATL